MIEHHIVIIYPLKNSNNRVEPGTVTLDEVMHRSLFYLGAVAWNRV